MRLSLPLFLALAACGTGNSDSFPVGASFDDDLFESLPSEAAPPVPQQLSLCHPPRIVPDKPLNLTATGAVPGERVFFLRGRSADGETCLRRNPSVCAEVESARLLGVAVADRNGEASLTATLSAALLPGQLVGFQAVAKRGPRGADTVASQPIEMVVQGATEPPMYCDSEALCPNLPDVDGDTIANQCDVCPGEDDLLDVDADGQADACDELNVSPAYVGITVDPNESSSTTVTIESALTVDAHYTADVNGCAWLSVNSGGAVLNQGTVPAGGVAQLGLTANATGMIPGQYTCSLTVSTDAAGYAQAGTIAVVLDVEEPGFDISFPAPDATTPTNIDSVLQVTTNNEAGAAAPGLQVSFTIQSPPPGVTFIETGTPVRTVSTDGVGKATATLDTPGGFEGEVLVDVVASDPSTGLELARTTLERRWVVMQGNIFFWEIWGAGGNIRKMPANLSAAPTVFRGTSYNGRCAGCHTVSPGVVPSTGRGAIFVQDRVSAPYYEQIVDTQTNAVLFQFPGDSSDNDWSPDSSKVAWSNGDLYVFDTNTGVNTVVAGANTGGAAEVFPTYSSDGSHIAYTNAVGSSYEHSGHALSILGGTSSIRTVNLATGATSELVPATPGYATFYPEFSPDGRWLVYNKSRTTMTGAATPSSYSSSTAEMWIVPVDPTGAYTTGPARQLTTANGSASVANSWPTWAPDSTFIAFGTNRSGDWDVYVSAISGSGTDSPAVPLAYGSATAAGPNGEHIPAWGP